ncbi:MAG: tetratricopeptide repeat protein [Burkholderiales bacterium]|jgi:predicted Zn-dependent protease|nr:tetratricopeptide repeat protein [Burkholderiales bacterium]
MPINLNDPEEPHCPLCHQKLGYLGAANTAQPLWERIPFFSRYISQKDALDHVAGDWTDGGLEENEYIPNKARALAEIYVREGRHDDALDALKEVVKAEPKNVMMHERYHRLLLTHGSLEQNHAHLMRAYLPLLLSKAPDRAVEVYLAAKKKLGDISPPPHPVICETLAQELIQKGHPAEGMQLIQDFHQRFPDYPYTPRVCMMAAKTLAYLLRDTDAAYHLIALIREHYPKSPQIVEANALDVALGRHSLKADPEQ